MVRLRKPHPCGGYDWQVVRLGADIGLRCLACERRILLERPVLERRLKEVLFRSQPTFSPALREMAAREADGGVGGPHTAGDQRDSQGTVP